MQRQMTPFEAFVHQDAILYHLLPHLDFVEINRLARISPATSQAINTTRGALHYVDLSIYEPLRARERLWVGTDPTLWSDDPSLNDPITKAFGALKNAWLLQGIHTLVLDGLPVPAKIIRSIVLDHDFNVRILSICGITHLHEPDLHEILREACSDRRQTPRLKALYYFTRRHPADGSTPLSDDTVDNWYHRSGDMFYNQTYKTEISEEWATTIQRCEGTISFDAVLCRGPCHQTSPSQSAAVATYGLRGCFGCGSAPEGITAWRDRHGKNDLSDYPLLKPLPRYSASVEDACRPPVVGDRYANQNWRFSPQHARLGPKIPLNPCRPTFAERHGELWGDEQGRSFVPRCFKCIRGRACMLCDRWWCETCQPQMGLERNGVKVRLPDSELCADKCVYFACGAGAKDEMFMPPLLWRTLKERNLIWRLEHPDETGRESLGEAPHKAYKPGPAPACW